MRRAGTRPATGPGRIASATGCLVVAAVAMLGAPVARAERTDVIVLINGDSVTGEIKELDRGLLRYKTDSAGTLLVEWEDVVTLSSKDSFEVKTTSGGRFFGSLTASERESPSVVVGIGEKVEILTPETVEPCQAQAPHWPPTDVPVDPTVKSIILAFHQDFIGGEADAPAE